MRAPGQSLHTFFTENSSVNKSVKEALNYMYPIQTWIPPGWQRESVHVRLESPVGLGFRPDDEGLFVVHIDGYLPGIESVRKAHYGGAKASTRKVTRGIIFHYDN